jgi:hypothetical protein
MVAVLRIGIYHMKRTVEQFATLVWLVGGEQALALMLLGILAAEAETQRPERLNTD